MGQVTNEVSIAIQSLNLKDSDIKLLDEFEGRVVFDKLLNHFVRSGDRRWWWEDFRQISFTFKDYESSYEQLNEIIPSTMDKVWLMVEDDEESYYPIYDVNPLVIKTVIDECFFFEYYIIDKNLEWLICENHHNRLIGIGEGLRVNNLERIAD